MAQPQRVPEPTSVKPVRLVVLPFMNMSGDPDQEYFADGITEGTIAELANVSPQNLGVIARTSAMHYKGSHKDIARIGRELAVDFAIEGSVRRSADQVRITSQLIRVADQTHLWGREFDSELRDVLQLEKEIAHSIAEQTLALQLDPASIAIRSTVAFVFQWSRQYERAILEARRTLELDQNALSAYWPLVMAEMAIGALDAAIQDAERSVAKSADPISLAYLGMALGLGGRREDAFGVLSQLHDSAASGCVSAVCPAWVHIGLGNHKLALDCLEKAFQEHDPMVLWIRAASSYDPLRGDPRFEHLLRRLGLPDLHAA